MDTSVNVQTTEARQMIAQVARWWWLWHITGVAWLAASVIILQFDRSSVTLVGLVIGVMFLVAGAEELALAVVSEGGWRWLWVVFGILLLGGGIWALFNPTKTFVAVADILGFVFLLVGIGWTLQAFASKEGNDLWWLGLIAGIIMMGLGFWASGQLLITQAYTLLVFAGIWALLHGVTDVIRAFQVRHLGKTLPPGTLPAES
jgi:uncharacterized membrane protein HdeD (DUF308 family)